MSSYYTEEMLVEMSLEADAALLRVAERLARRTIKNMLHIKPDAAAPYGGREQLFARLKASYTTSLSSAA
ncbi:hypothetical protein ACEUZ9_002857 [Paracoccus litorisediminis]|uniref:hypothetical protein n=1 Tax=Paracoccus litorisediminis TaxID=2006130 RepID=UPI003731E46E